MRVMCAWCGAVLSESAGAGPVSHGICASCSLTVERAFVKSRLIKRTQGRVTRHKGRSATPTLPLPGFMSAGHV